MSLFSVLNLLFLFQAVPLPPPGDGLVIASSNADCPGLGAGRRVGSAPERRKDRL